MLLVQHLIGENSDVNILFHLVVRDELKAQVSSYSFSDLKIKSTFPFFHSESPDVKVSRLKLA